MNTATRPSPGKTLIAGAAGIIAMVASALYMHQPTVTNIHKVNLTTTCPVETT